MLHPLILAGMIFCLLVMILIGGFVLLFPLTRQLGALLEQRLQSRQVEGVDPRELGQLRRAVQSLQDDLSRLAERQAFTESLLEERSSLQLPRQSAAAPAGADRAPARPAAS